MMTIPALTAEQQEQFEQLITTLDLDLKHEFSLERSTFLHNPLQRYATTYFHPIDKSLSRAEMRKAVESALYLNKIPAVHTIEGKGVYMRDKYNIGTFAVTIEIVCSKRGGRTICFSVAS